MAACSSILAQRIARTGESVVCGVAERQTQRAAVIFTLLLLNIYPVQIHPHYYMKLWFSHFPAGLF